ncbi:MAG: restriction endonuclease subunit S [Leptolyngbya sp. PLA1]|nr:restriction endonuclease subunit S [Leptolyngbya sp. PLA1]
MSSKPKPNSVKGDGEPGLVPKLRFPAFRSAPAWDLKRGDALFDAINNRSAAPGLPVLAITQEHGAIPRDHIDYHVSATAESIATYKEVCVGDFIISLRSFQGGIEYSRFHGICSPAYVILRRKGVGVDDYFRHLFKSARFIKQLNRNIEGLRDGKMISYAQFSEQLIPVPSPSEQRKIADCLISLDEAITTRVRKLDALGAHKRTLMQHLFPQDGQTVPRLRFPEFRDGPKWWTAPLGEAADFQSGGTPSKSIAAFWNGTIPWVSAKDMKHLFLEDTEDHITDEAIADGAKLVPPGTILILTRGMTLLKDVPICLPRRPMSFNQDVRAVRPRDGSDGRYLAFLLVSRRERLMRLVDMAGHGTGRLDTDKLKAMDVSIPHPEEQTRVADCLASLDATIAAEAAALDALKAHKHGLMQAMFPRPEEPS